MEKLILVLAAALIVFVIIPLETVGIQDFARNGLFKDEPQFDQEFEIPLPLYYANEVKNGVEGDGKDKNSDTVVATTESPIDDNNSEQGQPIGLVYKETREMKINVPKWLWQSLLSAYVPIPLPSASDQKDYAQLDGGVEQNDVDGASSEGVIERPPTANDVELQPDQKIMVSGNEDETGKTGRFEDTTQENETGLIVLKNVNNNKPIPRPKLLHQLSTFDSANHDKSKNRNGELKSSKGYWTENEDNRNADIDNTDQIRDRFRRILMEKLQGQ